MNIAILHYSVPPIVGGVESVIAHHARLMSADGHSVRLIAARGEALGEHISLVVMPLADSRHERVIQMKDGLDRGEVTEEFDVIRDKLAIELQTALTGVDVLIAHNVCSLNKNLALTAALHKLHISANESFAAYARSQGITGTEQLTANAVLVHYVESQIAGAIGSASARDMVASVVIEEPLALNEVMAIIDEASQALAYSRQLEQKSRELEAATNELRSANQRLQELDRLKDDFISTVTHELRTPLTSIRAFSEILSDNPQLDPEQRSKFLGIITRESERLTRLINQVLDLAKIESGAADWHPSEVDMREVLEDAVAALSYVHRIGRTARAGAEGIAISLCDHEERAFLRDIEKLIRMSIPATDQRSWPRPDASPAGERTGAPQKKSRQWKPNGERSGQPSRKRNDDQRPRHARPGEAVESPLSEEPVGDQHRDRRRAQGSQGLDKGNQGTPCADHVVYQDDGPPLKVQIGQDDAHLAVAQPLLRRAEQRGEELRPEDQEMLLGHCERLRSAGSSRRLGARRYGSDAKMPRRDEDLPQEREQAADQHEHGRDEGAADQHAHVEAEEGAEEEQRDHGADQQARRA